MKSYWSNSKLNSKPIFWWPEESPTSFRHQTKDILKNSSLIWNSWMLPSRNWLLLLGGWRCKQGLPPAVQCSPFRELTRDIHRAFCATPCCKNNFALQARSCLRFSFQKQITQGGSTGPPPRSQIYYFLSIALSTCCWHAVHASL